MGDKTKIEWTDATWNPLRGCSRVSEGCRNCYAESVAHRFSEPGMPHEGLTRIVNGHPAWTGEVRMIPELLDQPLRWRKPRRIFVNSMSDLFHENVPDYFIDRVFGVMWACHVCDRQHVFQILTKRAKRMRDYMMQDRRAQWARAAAFVAGGYDPDGMFDDIANLQGPHPRIWLGVSAENQPAADERIPLLLDTPAAVRWISAEPLLEAVDVSRWLDPTGIECRDVCPDSSFVIARDVEAVAVENGDIRPICPHCGQIANWTGRGAGIDWIVAGGESGPHARPTHPDWLRSLRDQCKTAGVPFLFKQWGEFSPSRELHAAGVISGHQQHSFPWGLCNPQMARVGKKLAGRRLDGVQHDEYPSNDYKS